MSRITHRGKPAFRYRVNGRYKTLTCKSENEVDELEKKLNACRLLGIPEPILEKIGSNRFSDESIARHWHKQKPELDATKKMLSLGEALFELYIPLDFEKNKATSTQQRERPVLNQFYKYFYDELEVDYLYEVEVLHLDKFAAFLAERGLKPQSINRHFNPIRRFFRWCLKRRLITSNPCEAIEPQREQEPKKAKWTCKQLEKLEELSKSEPKVYMWLWEVCFFMSLTGFRPCQATSLTFEDIDFDRRIIRTTSQKGKKLKVYFIPISDELLKFLNRRFKDARPKKNLEERVFLNSKQNDLTYNAIRCAFDRLKRRYTWAKGMTAYGGRHYFATKLEEAGVSTNKISKLLGHARVYTTQGYTEINELMLGEAVNSAQWHGAL